MALMTNYKIFYCPRCKTPLYCPHGQKTKKCPQCAKLIQIRRVPILKVTSELDDAIYVAQNLKVPPELRSKVKSSPKQFFTSQSKKDRFLELIQKLQTRSQNQPLDENLFLAEAQQAGLPLDWLTDKIQTLEQQGLLLRPKRGHIQFVL